MWKTKVCPWFMPETVLVLALLPVVVTPFYSYNSGDFTESSVSSPVSVFVNWSNQNRVQIYPNKQELKIHHRDLAFRAFGNPPLASDGKFYYGTTPESMKAQIQQDIRCETGVKEFQASRGVTGIWEGISYKGFRQDSTNTYQVHVVEDTDRGEAYIVLSFQTVNVRPTDISLWNVIEPDAPLLVYQLPEVAQTDFRFGNQQFIIPTANTIGDTMQVPEPPTVPPELQLYDNGVDVSNGSSHIILPGDKVVCSADYGFIQRHFVRCGDDERYAINSSSPAIFEASVLNGVSGDYDCVCIAEYSCWNNLNLETHFTLTLPEPLSGPPTISVNNEGTQSNGTSYVTQEGSQLQVVCVVGGGTPAVTDVTLTCGASHTNTSEGSQASLGLGVTRDLNGQVCVCSAQHVSQCYDQTTQFTIDVLEPTTIIKFTINSQTDGLEVTSDTSIVFACEAEGLPDPDCLIMGRYSNNNVSTSMVQVNAFTRRFEATKTIRCEDTDEYVFKPVDNPSAVGLSIPVRVVCPSQRLPGQEEQVESVTELKSGPASVKFLTISNPRPTEFTLVKLVQLSRRDKRATTQISLNPSDYYVTVEEINVREVELTLIFFDVNMKDGDVYKLSVSNGARDALQVSVHINITEDNVLDPAEKGKYTGRFIAAGTACAALMIFILLIYFILCRSLHSDFGRKKMKKNRVPPTRRVMVTPAAPLGTQPSARLWRQRMF